MKAIEFREYGDLDKLRLIDTPKPVPEDGEVLVRIHASSINSWDHEYFTGIPYGYRLTSGLSRPKEGKRRLGADIAGIVEAVGHGVTRFKPGDEVFGDLWDNWGGFAEYACTHESGLEPKPANLSFAEASAIPQAGGLALQGLKQTDPKPGESVLINGAGGGVGMFAVQLAKRAGAVVTGVDAPHKLDAVWEWGADRVLDHTREDFTATGDRYDVILDVQNTRSFFDLRRSLKPHGRYGMVGGQTHRILQTLALGYISSLTADTRQLRLVLGKPNCCLAELGELAESGKLRPAIDRSFALDDVPEALRYFGQGQHKGKIVITVAD